MIRTGSRWHLNLLVVAVVAFAVLALAACKRKPDTKALDDAGVGYSTIQALHDLHVTDEEVAQVAMARRAGLPDAYCLELVRLAHQRGALFTGGDSVAKLHEAGMSAESLLELGRLDHLGPWAGEAQALRLAGFSESLVLELARRRAQGQPSLSSPSLARLKNSGLNEDELRELVRQGTVDAQVNSILAERRTKSVPSGFRRNR